MLFNPNCFLYTCYTSTPTNFVENLDHHKINLNRTSCEKHLLVTTDNIPCLFPYTLV